MMNRLLPEKLTWLVLGLALAACAGATSPGGAGWPTGDSSEPDEDPPTRPAPTPLPAASLPDLGPAPDIANETWLNTDRPLNLAALEGKVVLVEFWTFG